MSNSCQQLKIDYEQLKKLKQEFVVVYEQVRKTGDLAEVKKLKKQLEKTKNKLDEKLFVSIEKAREILGNENVLGPEEVAKTWGVRLQEVPFIPFTRKMIENAAKMNQMLVLRVDKTAEGKPMSPAAMNEIWAKKQAAKGNLIKSLGNSKINYFTTTDILHSACFNETFYTKEAPRFGWALVSKYVLQESLDENFFCQTEIIASTIQDKAFNGMKVPAVYEEALIEFESQKNRLKKLMNEDWAEAAKQLSELKINQLARQSIQETIYDLAMYCDNSDINDHLLSSHCTWSNSRSLVGNLWVVGAFDLSGMGGWGCGPGFCHSLIGVCLSLRL